MTRTVQMEWRSSIQSRTPHALIAGDKTCIASSGCEGVTPTASGVNTSLQTDVEIQLPLIRLQIPMQTFACHTRDFDPLASHTA